MKDLRLRYAPSPTGYLHIGNARTALFNYLLAKHYGGKFIIRIEDTDLNRNVNDAIQKQFDDLKWLGIFEDESINRPTRLGPYRQLERLDIYKYYATELINQKKAYYCFCTSQELEKEREYQLNRNIKSPKYNRKCLKLSKKNIEILKLRQKYNIRFHVLSDKEYKYNDLVRGEISFNSNDIGDFVIIKSNGVPTYNFAVVIDDYLMQISHVLRGEEHISNTPRQLMIYETFKWETPVFGHLTLIVNKDRKKLSKRDNDIVQYINQYRKLGFLPNALVNFITLLGWSPETEKEIFTNDELIKIFDEKRFSKSPGMFDVEKLKWMNNQYIKKLTDEEYYNFCYSFLIEEYKFLYKKDKEWINDLIKLFKDELQYGKQIIELTNRFFDENYIFNRKFKNLFSNQNYSVKMIEELLEKFQKMEVWKEREISNIIKELGQKFNLKGKELYMSIRLATTNSDQGPLLIKVIYLFGKNKVIENIKYILKTK